MGETRSTVRVILHIDMNSFFASVEQAHQPSLKGLPLAVAGNPQERRGILVTCSYEARAYGVYTTMTIGEAKRLCPELIIVPPDFSKYRTASAAIFDILRTYTKWVEPVSIDEAYMDITSIGGLTNAHQIAQDIQARLLSQLDLPCSIGIAPNKFLAKMASDFKKPLGITILRKRELPLQLWPLPVIEMHGVGKSTETKLQHLGISTIGELASADEAILRKKLGKNGIRLRNRANGIDFRPVDPDAAEERKSVGSSTTLPVDITDVEEALSVFQQLSEKVARRLEQKALAGSTITIQIRTADWKNQTRSHTLVNPIYKATDLYDEACYLFRKHWQDEPIRLLGITVGNVVARSALHEQLTIDSYEHYEKIEKLNELVVKMERKFGPGSIQRGTTDGRDG